MAERIHELLLRNLQEVFGGTEVGSTRRLPRQRSKRYVTRWRCLGHMKHDLAV